MLAQCRRRRCARARRGAGGLLSHLSPVRPSPPRRRGPGARPRWPGRRPGGRRPGGGRSSPEEGRGGEVSRRARPPGEREKVDQSSLHPRSLVSLSSLLSPCERGAPWGQERRGRGDVAEARACVCQGRVSGAGSEKGEGNGERGRARVAGAHSSFSLRHPHRCVIRALDASPLRLGMSQHSGTYTRTRARRYKARRTPARPHGMHARLIGAFHLSKEAPPGLTSPQNPPLRHLTGLIQRLVSTRTR